MADFQKALLGESLNLGISRVPSAYYSLQNKERVEVANCAVHIWHEDRNSPSARVDITSRIINGTKLSGPPLENTRPRCSRVIVFLPRKEEYLFFFSESQESHVLYLYSALYIADDQH